MVVLLCFCQRLRPQSDDLGATGHFQLLCFDVSGFSQKRKNHSKWYLRNARQLLPHSLTILFTMILSDCAPHLYFFVQLHRYTLFQTDYHILNKIMQPMYAEMFCYIMHQCTDHKVRNFLKLQMTFQKMQNAVEFCFFLFC